VPLFCFSAEFSRDPRKKKLGGKAFNVRESVQEKARRKSVVDCLSSSRSNLGGSALGLFDGGTIV